MLTRNLVRTGVLSAVILSLAACGNTNDNGVQNNAMDNGNVRSYGIDRYMDDQDLGMNRDIAGNRGQVRNNARNDSDLNDQEQGMNQELYDEGMNGNRGTVSNGLHQNTKMVRADEIVRKLEAMKDIESANVLLTDQNAYVAIELESSANQNGNRTYSQFNSMEDSDQVSDKIKQKVSDTIKKMNPDIENVYVSANPDFMDRMNGYMEQLDDGKPVRGFINEFNTMVERMFPNNPDRDVDMN